LTSNHNFYQWNAAGSADGMMRMLRCMVVMFTTLMQLAIEGEKHAEMIALHVRLFLNAVVEFKANMKRNETKPLLVKRKDPPMWLLQSNFLCLLNLSDTVREFGSLLNNFEGKYLGERFVQEVKDARQHCSHQNVTTNLLKKLHQGKAMASTQSEKVNVYKPTGQFNTKKESLKGNVRVYRDCQQANLSFHSQKPISAMCLLAINRCHYNSILHLPPLHQLGPHKLHLNSYSPIGHNSYHTYQHVHT
jgi:hypothetical protein